MKISAGILMYKIKNGNLEVFLVHPGGPFWEKKDERAWDFPKGEPEENEELLTAAIRETKEETGIDLSKRNKEEFISLGNIKRKDGKEVNIWAIDGDWPGLLICSSYVNMKDKSGKEIKFPEVNRAGFFKIEDAREKVFLSLEEFLDRLEEKVGK